MTTADSSPKVDELTELLNQTTSSLQDVFERMAWAEEEIDKAMVRHPWVANDLYHSFMLLVPTSHLMGTEFVYRSHCRELLDRVIKEEDTRPGTAAEVCCLCCDSSMVAPLTSAATGLYMRMWKQAFPQQPQMSDNLEHYEALHSSVIDDHEKITRRKLGVPTRQLINVECPGRHHGEPVECKYAKGNAAT